MAFLLVRPAAADTIRVTQGTVEVLGFGEGPTQFRIEGERGFVMDASTGSGNGLFCTWAECVPGATVTIENGWGGLDLYATVTLDGSSFTVGTPNSGDAIISFVASELLPPFSGPTSTVVAPFTFAGTIYDMSLPRLVNLIGRGTVTTTYRHITGVEPNEFYIVDRSVFRFSSSPVPEPATMGLVGAGLLFGLGSRKRKR